MSEALFNIIFKGRYDRNLDKDQAIIFFASLFKIPNDKAAKFFDGKPRALKKSVNLDAASKFRSSLKRAGLRVSLKKIVSEEDIKPKITMSEVGVVIANKPFIQPPSFESSKFSIDEVGVEIVEKVTVQHADIEMKDYVINDVGEQLAEKKIIPDADIDTSNITVDEVGATVDTKKHIAVPDLDISNIDMEEVGATIVEKENIPEPVINIDNIKFAD